MVQAKFFQDTPSGKTSPERFQATTEKIFGSSSKASRKSQTPRFQFLDLTTTSGTPPEWWRDGITQLHGGHLMLNFGECPSVAVESSLSQILEANAHPKYFLSAKACRGILRRAETRGKKLPEALKAALERQALSRETAPAPVV